MSAITPPGPVVPRRRIARELRQLREKHHLRLEELARETEVSTSTLSRLENAQGTANALTIRAIVDYYKIGGTERGKNLIAWARDGRKQGWWQGFPGATVESPNPSYVAYEAQASVARLYVIPFIPALFQTSDYAARLSRDTSPDHTDADIENLLKFRHARQQNMRVRQGQDPLMVNALLHESCLTQTVGSAEIMRDQLQHLLRLTKELKGTVTIRVLPQSARPHPAMRCTWSHFEYSPDVDGVVWMESLLGLRAYEDKAYVNQALHDFDELAERSLTVRKSTALIDSVIEQNYS